MDIEVNQETVETEESMKPHLKGLKQESVAQVMVTKRVEEE